MVIHFVGSIEHFLSVRGFAGNIVHGMNEQNEIILHRIVILYDFIVKFFQQVFILQGRGTELHQKVLGTPGFLRCQGKFHSEEIFTHRAGKSFAENGKIFKHFFFRQGKEGFLQLGFFIFFSVYITTADTGDGTPLLGKLLFDFCNFFLIHNIL